MKWRVILEQDLETSDWAVELIAYCFFLRARRAVPLIVLVFWRGGTMPICTAATYSYALLDVSYLPTTAVLQNSNSKIYTSKMVCG